MTTTEIKTFFENLIDDAWDETATLQLMNQADAVIRSEREWEILKKIDASKTASPGDTYLSMKDLPTDFDRAVSIVPLRVNRTPYLPVRFEEREGFRDTPLRWYIDYRARQFALTGGIGSAQTIYLPYIYKPLDLALSADATHLDAPVWPSQFHVILAYKMAEIHSLSIDTDDIAAKQGPQQLRAYRELLNAMQTWDANLKLQGMNYQAGFDVPDQGALPLSMWDH